MQPQQGTEPGRLRRDWAGISCQLPSDQIRKHWLMLGVQLKTHQPHLKNKNKKPSCDSFQDLFNNAKSLDG